MPQFTGTDPSALCSLLPRSYILTGEFRDILTRHFITQDTIQLPELKELIWRPEQDTNILIESVNRWIPESTEHRPAILIKRNAFQNNRQGIGDRRQGPPVDMYGDPHYVTYWTGSHTIFCVSNSGVQAELLATEVLLELVEFAPIISRNLQLHRLQVLQIGAVSEIEEAQENFAVPITVGYSYEHRWVIRQQTPNLTRISLES